MALNMRQKNVLREVAEAEKREPDRALQRSCTNPTLSALERRGLVVLDFVPSRHVPTVSVERWRVTDAGREALR